jgi:hypothetical protein
MDLMVKAWAVIDRTRARRVSLVLTNSHLKPHVDGVRLFANQIINLMAVFHTGLDSESGGRYVLLKMNVSGVH